MKLLLYSTCQDREILGKILARTRTLHTHTDIIDFVAAEECGKENSERLLSMKEVAARTGLTGDCQGGGGVRCYACQSPGHTKPECKVEKSKLWCAHCRQRGVHNTNKFCKAFKRDNDKKEDKEQGGGKEDPN